MLFDVPRRPKPPPWHGTLAVVRWRVGHLCPLCDAPLRADRGSDVLALFWMHGYGAVIRTTHLTCPCGYRRHWPTETITPRTKAP